MNVGITAIFKGTAFSASLPQVAVFIGRALKAVGHKVHFLIPPAESNDWFDDCADGTGIERIKIQTGINVALYDLIIEICWYLSPDLRKQIGSHVVMFYNEPPAFHDMEKSVYACPTPVRNFKNVDALWTWSHYDETDITYLEILSRLPIHKIPYIWEPFFLENCTKNGTNGTKSEQGAPHIIICENNKSNTSSCIIPLTILSEIRKNCPQISWSVMNATELMKRPYFIKNIVENLNLGEDISGHFMGRVRTVDFSVTKCCILSHQRWLPIKYLLLDALWLGIPLIHNCAMINSITGGENFYDLNRIDKALKLWEVLKDGSGPILNLAETKSEINSRWGPENFKIAVREILAGLPKSREPLIKLAFCDMWADFNPDHNLFTGLFKFAKIKFIKDQINPNLIIFGPFGETNKNFNSVSKIYYTGENLQPIYRPDVKLNIGFEIRGSDNYVRIPNWVFELNLFGIDEFLAKNPSPFNPKLLYRKQSGFRNKFCIFVASRPMCNERNTIYNVISRYKKVDSCGRVFKNSDWIPSGPGGSNGQKAKVQAYESYKFAIVGENSKSKGYITEKLLHAKLGGCVPIYWGDDVVNLDFEKGSFINVADFANEDDLLTHIAYLDGNDAAWKAIADKPLLKEGTLAQWKELCVGLAKRCVAIIQNVTNENKYEMEPVRTSSSRIIVTALNGKFIQSAIRLIKSSPVEIHLWVWDMTVEQKRALVQAGAKGIYDFNCDWVPKDFTDFWNPEHYAWKPLLWNELQKRGVLKPGTSVLYLDSGAEIVGDLTNIWSIIDSEDVFLTHIEHKMVAWCKPEFAIALSMTIVEGETLQYASGIVGFKIGGKFKDVFVKTAEYGKDPVLICGKKWHQYSKICYGHRQDQSILSLVGIRANVKTHDYMAYSCEISQSQARKEGKPFYIHRGLWKKTLMSEIDGISSFCVVNLAHREDRLAKFYEAHPFLKEKCLRVEAVYGKQMSLTIDAVRLFKNNDFNWKKGVIGCALSHYELWKQIAKGEHGTNVLILEDDAVLANGFVSTWNSIVDSLPSDSDIIMLGGVLPPNKKILPHITEQVNENFGRIKPHRVGEHRSVCFHFCTYSYVLTISGAKKLCALIDEKGIFTSIDHMICNHMNTLLNLYFTTPLLAGCFQDTDEAYVNADFNNFNRIDKYDSEIWNNTDVFCCSDLSGILPIIYFDSDCDNLCFYQNWLEEITGRKFIGFHCSEAVRFPRNTVVCLYYSNNTRGIVDWISKHTELKLFLLHLNDDACNSDVHIYNNANIIKVFRNYWRPDVVDFVNKKVIHLPLGYIAKRSEQNKPIGERKYSWSFVGAMDRPARKEILESIQKTGLVGKIHTVPNWGSGENLSASEYLDILSETKIVPCLPGLHNAETSRFYETLENGAIPMVLLDEKNSFANILGGSVNPPLLGISGTDWGVVSILAAQDKILTNTNNDMQLWWVGYKLYLKKLMHSVLTTI